MSVEFLNNCSTHAVSLVVADIIFLFLAVLGESGLEYFLEEEKSESS